MLKIPTSVPFNEIYLHDICRYNRKSSVESVKQTVQNRKTSGISAQWFSDQYKKGEQAEVIKLKKCLNGS